MSTNCPTSPENKKEYISDIGKILVKDYGKKEFYEPEEVKKAHEKSKWYDGLDFSCWGMSSFCSHASFDAYHEMYDEACDYVEMKKEMLLGLSTSDTLDWTSIPDFDIDVSWLHMGDMFDGVLEGIGDFFSGIFDSL